MLILDLHYYDCYSHLLQFVTETETEVISQYPNILFRKPINQSIDSVNAETDVMLKPTLVTLKTNIGINN